MHKISDWQIDFPTKHEELYKINYELEFYNLRMSLEKKDLSDFISKEELSQIISEANEYSIYLSKEHEYEDIKEIEFKKNFINQSTKLLYNIYKLDKDSALSMLKDLEISENTIKEVKKLLENDLENDLVRAFVDTVKQNQIMIQNVSTPALINNINRKIEKQENYSDFFNYIFETYLPSEKADLVGQLSFYQLIHFENDLKENDKLSNIFNRFKENKDVSKSEMNFVKGFIFDKLSEMKTHSLKKDKDDVYGIDYVSNTDRSFKSKFGRGSSYYANCSAKHDDTMYIGCVTSNDNFLSEYNQIMNWSEAIQNSIKISDNDLGFSEYKVHAWCMPISIKDNKNITFNDEMLRVISGLDIKDSAKKSLLFSFNNLPAITEASSLVSNFSEKKLKRHMDNLSIGVIGNPPIELGNFKYKELVNFTVENVENNMNLLRSLLDSIPKNESGKTMLQDSNMITGIKKTTLLLHNAFNSLKNYQSSNNSLDSKVINKMYDKLKSIYQDTMFIYKPGERLNLTKEPDTLYKNEIETREDYIKVSLKNILKNDSYKNQMIRDIKSTEMIEPVLTQIRSYHNEIQYMATHMKIDRNASKILKSVNLILDADHISKTEKQRVIDTIKENENILNILEKVSKGEHKQYVTKMTNLNHLDDSIQKTINRENKKTEQAKNIIKNM